MKTTRRGLFRSIFAAAALPYIPQPVARGVSLAAVRAHDREFFTSSHKIGETIYVRKPARNIARDGQRYQLEEPARFVATNGRPLVINQRFGVDFDFHTP